MIARCPSSMRVILCDDSVARRTAALPCRMHVGSWGKLCTGGVVSLPTLYHTRAHWRKRVLGAKPMGSRVPKHPHERTSTTWMLQSQSLQLQIVKLHPGHHGTDSFPICMIRGLALPQLILVVLLCMIQHVMQDGNPQDSHSLLAGFAARNVYLVYYLQRPEKSQQESSVNVVVGGWCGT